MGRIGECGKECQEDKGELKVGVRRRYLLNARPLDAGHWCAKTYFLLEHRPPNSGVSHVQWDWQGGGPPF